MNNAIAMAKMKRWSVAVFMLLGWLLVPPYCALAQSQSLTFHTGAVGGLYMEPGVIWAGQWEKAIPNLKVSVVLGGSTTNPITVSRGEPNSVVGVADSISAHDVQIGEGEYKQRIPQGIKNLRAIWRFNVESWSHIVARPGVVPSGVKTIDELLKRKPALRWVFKVRGSADETMSSRIFSLHGLSYKDLESWGGKISFNNPNDSAKLLIDGHADILIATARVPAAYLLEMDASIQDMKWLGLDEKSVDELNKKYGYGRGTHPLGSYTTLKEKIPAVNTDHVVFVQEGMNEDLVYKMTKAVLSDPDKVKAIAALKPFDPKVVWSNTVFPLHRGAERAYREMNFMK
jgi:TRAP transporter TAXI family solute receptor